MSLKTGALNAPALSVWHVSVVLQSLDFPSGTFAFTTVNHALETPLRHFQPVKKYDYLDPTESALASDSANRRVSGVRNYDSVASVLCVAGLDCPQQVAEGDGCLQVVCSFATPMRSVCQKASDVECYVLSSVVESEP